MQSNSVGFEDLPEDLKIEVFRLLRYKDLMSCKCVSKRWLSLISNPHLTVHSWIFGFDWKNQKLPALDYSDSVFQSNRLSLDFLPFYKDKATHPIRIVQIVNDVYLCFVSHPNNVLFYICNPITAHWLCLPPSGFEPFSSRLAFQPCHRHPAGKFCMCKFKVVQLRHSDCRPDFIRLQVFSSSTGQWARYHVRLNTPYSTGFIRGFEILKNSFYALPQEDHFGILVVDLSSILLSDLDCPVPSHSRVIGFPKVPNLEDDSMSIDISTGRLRATCVAVRAIPVLYIWELKEDDEWSLLHSVSFANMIALKNKEWFSGIVHTRLPPQEREYLLFKLGRFHPLDKNVLYLNLHGRSVSYNMQTKELSFHPKFDIFGGATPAFAVLLPWSPTRIPKVLNCELHMLQPKRKGFWSPQNRIWIVIGVVITIIAAVFDKI